MTKKTWQRNTNGLVAHAKRRAEHKQQQVDQAIDKLLREKKPINFNAVATAAEVAKAYLYHHPELRNRIEMLRASQRKLVPPHRSPSERTESSREVLLAAKDRRIKEQEQEQENQRLKEALKMALGRLYEQV
ncbi:DUF6262 family protein [Ktedonobacter racemifer]|uniref:Transposase n=1 Tax=Ktedonobacter racemifer DSM 44963 TaxID=485913 RepID=D6TCL5_KTERA|nr:DUF6262 family protein [Ktedonobacter racemifer]EFH88129.1 conserved hypothetical protein [Ktedonobacter racemifer DSM 44963]